MVMIREWKKKRKDPDCYAVISAQNLRHLTLNKTLIHFHAATPRKPHTVCDLTAKSLLDRMSVKGSHRTGSGVLFLRQKSSPHTVCELRGARKTSTKTTRPQQNSKLQIPWGVGHWETLSSVSVLRTPCSSDSFPSRETFLQPSTGSLCWAMLPPLLLL